MHEILRILGNLQLCKDQALACYVSEWVKFKKEHCILLEGHHRINNKVYSSKAMRGSHQKPGGTEMDMGKQGLPSNQKTPGQAEAQKNQEPMIDPIDFRIGTK